MNYEEDFDEFLKGRKDYWRCLGKMVTSILNGGEDEGLTLEGCELILKTMMLGEYCEQKLARDPAIESDEEFVAFVTGWNKKFKSRRRKARGTATGRGKKPGKKPVKGAAPGEK